MSVLPPGRKWQIFNSSRSGVVLLRVGWPGQKLNSSRFAVCSHSPAKSHRKHKLLPSARDMGLPINPKGPTPSIVLDTGTPLKCSRSRPFSCEISTGQTVRPNCISDFCFIHEPTSMMVPLVRDRHRQTFDTTPSSGDNREVASLQHVGLWRSWERASMAWKRSSVRSRSGPPNNPCILRYLPTPPRRDLVSKGCGRVLKFLHFERQHQFNDSQARFALLLIYRAGVNIKRRAAARMSHQFRATLMSTPSDLRLVAREWRKLCQPICLPTIPIRANAGRTLFSRMLSGLRGLFP